MQLKLLYFSKTKKQLPYGSCFYKSNLLFDNLKNFHGASLNADTAGNALGNGILSLMYHDLHGAHSDTSATADTQFLIDHVNAGLGILGDRAVLTGLHALTALDAGHRLGAGTLCNDLDRGIVLMEFLVKGLGTGANAFQTSHTFNILFNSKLLHNKGVSFMYLILVIIMEVFENSNG